MRRRTVFSIVPMTIDGVAQFAGGGTRGQREVFDLADLQGIPLTDIAEMLGLSAVTARVHLHRARAAIRARILAESPALVEDF